MTQDAEEYEKRKRAVFEGMSKKGRERVLKIGYDKWEPFQEPKDPRERIFGNTSLQVTAWLREFYDSSPQNAESVAVHKDLFDMGVELLRGERRGTALFNFCAWLLENKKSELP